jgi:MoaA/NifB/PqqE/SkfB family radical SAM enzyme
MKISKIFSIFKDINSLKKGRIRYTSIYVTNKCNSRCKICSIWRHQPKNELEPDVIEKIFISPFTRGAEHSLTGGEFFLHSRWEEILKLANKYKINYTIFTNGLLTETITYAVKKFKIPNISISLDGTPSTYKEVRGIDGYTKVIETIKKIKDRTRISLTYVANPLNTEYDLLHVKNIVKKYNLNLNIVLFETRLLFKPNLEGQTNYDYLKNEKRGFIQSFFLWREGKLNIPCWSIFLVLNIMPNGDVILCQNKNIKLGNLYEVPLEKIWISKKTKNIQKKYLKCNECWIACNRPIDNRLRFFEKFIKIKNIER